jgi:hypothetical protein
MLFELFVVTMALNLKLSIRNFCHDLGLKHQFSSPCVACRARARQKWPSAHCRVWRRTTSDSRRVEQRRLTEG